MKSPTLDELRAGRQQHLDMLLANRESLDDAEIWRRGLKGHGIALDTVIRIMRILSEVLEVNLCRIRARDDFSKELSFFWDIDSLADLKIMHALEVEFGITISDGEAASMKTLRDIALGVHRRISVRQ